MQTPQSHPSMEEIRHGVDARFPVQLRRAKYSLRPLSTIETINTSREVAREIAEIPEEERLSMDETTRLAIKQLELASTSEPGSFDPKLSAKVLEQLTPEEIAYLWKQYTGIREKCNPMLEEMPIEEVQYLVEQVKKNPSEIASTLTDRSFLELVNISRFLIQQELQAAK